mgnify:CR=1 FL=1
MAQNKFKMGKTKSSMVTIAQPLGEMANAGETTYTSDSGRTKSGVNVVKPLFTVEQYSLAFTNLTKSEYKQIMNIIKHGKKFWMHYYSTATSSWETEKFYCGKYDGAINTLKDGEERFDLSFNVEGVNPV